MALFSKAKDETNGGGCYGCCQQQPIVVRPWIHRQMDRTVSLHECHNDQQPKGTKTARRPPFRAPRLAHAPDFPQQQTQIIGRTLEGMRFAHIGLTLQPTPPAAAGLADMGKGSFAPLTAPTIQSPPLFSTHALSVGPEGRLVGGGFVGPTPGLLAALSNIRPHAPRRHVRQ